MERIIAGLDLGTFTIKVAVAKIGSDGYMDLLGIHEAPAHGISKGNIIDLAEASGSVESLMAEVKEKHGPKIFKVVLSLGGVGFSSERSKGSLVLQRSPRELTQYGVEKAIQSARNMSFSLDRFVLHEIVEDYILDEQRGIKNPVGLFARKVEVNLYTLFYNMANVQNAITCVDYAGYDVEKVVFSGLASLECVVDKDGLENGVVLLDIGHETTKIIVAEESKIKFCNILNIGGLDISKSISSKFKIPMPSAEAMKLNSSFVGDAINTREENIIVGGKEKEILKSEVKDVIKRKTEQLLNMIKKELIRSSLIDCIKSGIVITGGGASQEGLPQRLEGMFKLPVRVGVVRTGSPDIGRPSHLFAPSIGALEYYAHEIRQKKKGTKLKTPISRLTHRISTFINDYF